jgi:hypothetical protein
MKIIEQTKFRVWCALRFLPSRRYVHEFVKTEQAILQIAAVISCPASGYSYERLQKSCRKVALLYPTTPTYRTLEKLCADIATSEPTPLAHAFYGEYCKKQ